jgi:hypothetical protein
MPGRPFADSWGRPAAMMDDRFGEWPDPPWGDLPNGGRSWCVACPGESRRACCSHRPSVVIRPTVEREFHVPRSLRARLRLACRIVFRKRIQ